jgi:hypothetical protein
MNPQALATQLQFVLTELRALKARMAQFEGITGISAGPTDMVDPVTVAYDSGTRTTTLHWRGAAGAFYRVETTSDLGASWSVVTGGENIPTATSILTTFITPALAPSPPLTFYRIRRNPYVCTPAVS